MNVEQINSSREFASVRLELEEIRAEMSKFQVSNDLAPAEYKAQCERAGFAATLIVQAMLDVINEYLTSKGLEASDAIVKSIIYNVVGWEYDVCECECTGCDACDMSYGK